MAIIVKIVFLMFIVYFYLSCIACSQIGLLKKQFVYNIVIALKITLQKQIHVSQRELRFNNKKNM